MGWGIEGRVRWGIEGNSGVGDRGKEWGGG